MSQGNKIIELRSEKVRNIVGQAPPVLLRYGISIIGLSLFILLVLAAFIPYQPTIKTAITVRQDTLGVLHYSADIPGKSIQEQAQFTCILIDSASDLSLPNAFQIESISDTAQLSENRLWYAAVLSPMSVTPRTLKLKIWLLFRQRFC
jgi:hypothetical protein